MNFLMEPEIALQNAEKLGYLCPNTSVAENDEYSYKGNEILYPSEEDMPKTQWFHDLDPEIIKYYEELWVGVKNS